MEQILRDLIRNKGQAYLREGKYFVYAFRELGGTEKDTTLLQFLVETGGHLELLDAGTLSPAMQRSRYGQVVDKLCEKKLISQELAHSVCAGFWRAVYQKDPPVIWTPPKPVSPKSAPPKPEPLKPAPQKPELPKPEPPKPAPPTRTHNLYNDFYITEKEAQTGGPIRVYLSDGGHEVHILPLNIRSGQSVQPIAWHVHPGSGWKGTKNMNTVSDGRLMQQVTTGYLKDCWKTLYETILDYFIFVVSISFCWQMFFKVMSWLLGTVLNLEWFRSEDLSGFTLYLPPFGLYFPSLGGISSWFDINNYLNCRWELLLGYDSFGEILVSLILIGIPAIALLELWESIRDILRDRKKMIWELERRSKL